MTSREDVRLSSIEFDYKATMEFTLPVVVETIPLRRIS